MRLLSMNSSRMMKTAADDCEAVTREEYRHMDRVKEILSIVFGGRLVIDGSGRTFAKAPVWLCVLLALGSMKLAVITVLLVVAFGMRARLVRA